MRAKRAAEPDFDEEKHWLRETADPETLEGKERTKKTR